MCGIIGVCAQNKSKMTIKIVKSLLEESQIRGKHATGISFIDKNGIMRSIVIPINAKKFIEECDFTDDIGKKLCLIGHTRYSTSDLRYNQPIFSEENSIVHNGIVTQKDPEFWEKLYGYKCIGRNDSELILRCIENNEHPLLKFKNSSLAIANLHHTGEIHCYRNGDRPLWFAKYNEEYYFASTEDILKRTFAKVRLKVSPEKCICGRDYHVRQNGFATYKNICETEDKQLELQCSKYYTKVK